MVLFWSASAGLTCAAVLNMAGTTVQVFEPTAKATVLVFVRSDCPLCNRYAPALNALARKYGAGVQFWLVYPGRSQSVSAIEKQVSDYSYRLPVARDPDGELVKLSRAETTPQAAVFDADRTLVYHGRIDNWYEDFGRARSAPTTHELNDAIQAVVAGKKPRVQSAPAVGCSIADLE